MTKQEWERKYRFTNNTPRCGDCKYCYYDGDLDITYCEKMYQDIGDASQVECQVDEYKDSCKVVIEE